MKKGDSSTIINVILLAVGVAIVVFLIIYFGVISKGQTSSFLDKLSFLRRGE